MSFFKRVKNKLEYEENKLISKLFFSENRVLVIGISSIYTNTIEMANYIAANSNKTVYYSAPSDLIPYAKKLLSENVKVIRHKGRKYRYVHVTSKYLFKALGYPHKFSDKQRFINTWHGVPYKMIGMPIDKRPRLADVTVATSPLTQKIFAKAFDVSSESVFISGYPRNDVLIRTNKEKDVWRNKILGKFDSFGKVIIWLPTWRQSFSTASLSDYGKAVDNVFQVENFNVEKFNTILKQQNTLCIVKPHLIAEQKEPSNVHSNIFVINDQWLWSKGMTIYHLAACTDGLISDVSSVIVDYLLIDKPIICFWTDFKEFKQSRGLMFDDIENWLPSPIIKQQELFFKYLKQILKNGTDNFAKKRQELRDKFFTHQDEQSAKRLMEYVFDENKPKKQFNPSVD